MKLYQQFALVPLIAALTACGGSSGSKAPGKDSDNSSQSSASSVTTSLSSSSQSSLAVLSGRLVDSDVANVAYSTPTQSGVTSETGTFYYVAGESVTFSIGELVFSDVPGAPIVSPLQLAGSDDLQDPAVINIARLLQTIDADKDPSNGIMVSDAAIAAMKSVDFSLPVDEFANQSEVSSLLAAIGATSLVDAEAAVAHLRDSLGLASSSSSVPASSAAQSSSAPASSSAALSSAVASSLAASSVVPAPPSSSVAPSSTPASSAAPSSTPASSAAPSSSPASSSVSSVPASSAPASSAAPSSEAASSSSAASSEQASSSSSVASSEVSSSSSSVASSEVSSSSSSSSSVPSYSYTFPSGSGIEVISHARHQPWVATDAGPVVVAVFDSNYNIVAVKAPSSPSLKAYTDPSARSNYSPNHMMATGSYTIEQRLNQVFIWLANEASDSTGTSLIGKNLNDTSIQYIGLWDGSNTVSLDREAALAFFQAAVNLGIDVTASSNNNVTKAKGSFFKVYNDRIDEIRKDHNAQNATVTAFTTIAEKVLAGADNMLSAGSLGDGATPMTFHEITTHPVKGAAFRKITTDETEDTALGPWEFHQWSGFMNTTHKTVSEGVQIIYLSNSAVYNAPNFSAAVSGNRLRISNTLVQDGNLDGKHFDFHMYGQMSLEGRSVREFARVYLGGTLASKIDENAVFTTQGGETPSLYLGDMRYLIPVRQTPLEALHWAMFPYTAPDDNNKCPYHGTYANTVNFAGNCAAAPGWYRDGGQDVQVTFVDNLGSSARYAYTEDLRWFKIGFGTASNIAPRLEGNDVGGSNRYGMNNYVRSLIGTSYELRSTTDYYSQSTNLDRGRVLSLTDATRLAIGARPYHDYVSFTQGNVVRVGKQFTYGNTVNNTEASKYFLNAAAYAQIAAYLPQ